MRTTSIAFLWFSSTLGFVNPRCHQHASVSCFATTLDDAKTARTDGLLEVMSTSTLAREWANTFGFGDHERAFYALFEGIRKEIPLGLKGKPFVLRETQIKEAVGVSFQKFFTLMDLEKALHEEFLWAGRGTTDNQKAWEMFILANPNAETFEEARPTFQDVQLALTKGTVIFNAAGAHIPKLAGPTLACTDATALPNGLNVYVSEPQMHTSAPPHTDKQDVVVVQTSGQKRWRVYSPPDPSKKPLTDMFDRGKGEDPLPLDALESELGCDLLLDTTLNEGDVLFIPAAFPHTTDTVCAGLDEMSIHLTFGLDTHIWGLDYLSLRHWALQRYQVTDSKLGQNGEKDNPYMGAVNQLSRDLIVDLMEALPMGFLDDDAGDAEMELVCSELERIAKTIDESVASKVSTEAWKEATQRIQRYGKELLEIHRDMYVTAFMEQRVREAEELMRVQTQSPSQTSLAPEREHWSIVRVKWFFDRAEGSRESLFEWAYSRNASDIVADDKSGLSDN